MRLMLRIVAVLALLAAAAAPAAAACLHLSGAPPLFQHASFRPASVPAGQLRLTFVGHASFEIESPEGIRAVTDYNGFLKPPRVPHIVTMNNSHSGHYTDIIDPAILFPLRGWSEQGILNHDVRIKDMRVRNVPTNLRPVGPDTAHGNSIFVFEAADLCVAHISHVHHRLSDDQLRQLGLIDVALVAIDGAVTMTHAELFEALDKMKPRLIVPMHMISLAAVERFTNLAAQHYPVRHHESETILLQIRTLPAKPEVLFMKGR